MAHKTDDLLNLLNFLFWYEQEDPRALWGGVRMGDAMESCRKLLGFTEDHFEILERICLGELKADELRPKMPEEPSIPLSPQAPGSED